ncbi:MAG: hypothetical protein ACREYA_32410 [Cupriavidus necator]
MDARRIIKLAGGTKEFQRLTGLSFPQISHYRTRDYIPSHQIRLLIALMPELDWPELLGENTLEYIGLLNDRRIKNVRTARLRSRKPLEIVRLTEDA